MCTLGNTKCICMPAEKKTVFTVCAKSVIKLSQLGLDKMHISAYGCNAARVWL